MCSDAGLGEGEEGLWMFFSRKSPRTLIAPGLGRDGWLFARDDGACLSQGDCEL